VSITPIVALHGFASSTMLLSRFNSDIVHRRSPHAAPTLPFASRTFDGSAGIDCAIELRTFLGGGTLVYQAGYPFAFSETSP
jgi:hypothetical protein